MYIYIYIRSYNVPSPKITTFKFVLSDINLFYNYMFIYEFKFVY